MKSALGDDAADARPKLLRLAAGGMLVASDGPALPQVSRRPCPAWTRRSTPPAPVNLAARSQQQRDVYVEEPVSEQQCLVGSRLSKQRKEGKQETAAERRTAAVADAVEPFAAAGRPLREQALQEARTIP